MFELSHMHFSAPLALALVATLGYLIGRRRNQPNGQTLRSRRELRRAQSVARELERIAWMVRKNLSRHHASLSRFKDRVGILSRQQEEEAWKDLCREANEILTSTLRLATQIATAYDQIRQQTNHLMAFREVRTDPLTGIANRRGLEDALATQFALASRYEDRFAVILVDIDHFKNINDQQGHLQGDRCLQQLATLLDASARETDTVGRYGGEEFLLVLPRTDLEGASVMAERIRAKVEKETSLSISAGVAAMLDGDTPESLLQRADAALYQAKSAGRNRVFRHNGQAIESVLETADTALGA